MKYPWSLKPAALTPRFWSALVEWQRKGERSVKVEIETDKNLSIFCYDSKAMEGHFVSKISEIPTTKRLLVLKRKTIERERAELQRQLDEMEDQT